MLGISSFFERFRSRELEETAFRSAVADSVREAAGYELEPAAFSYSNGTVFIQASPAARSAIFLKKGQILKKIAERTRKPVSDLR
jgi:hypothetical protein